MSITFTPDIEAWLQAHVATGDYASVEEAVRQLIAERIAELGAEEGRREALLVGDLSDEELASIAASEMNPRHKHLDCEL